MTANKLINLTAISAIAAGLMFIVIQPLHPADALESVTRTDWAVIHYASLLMQVLFVVGISGIYASQVEELGWLGLIGYVVLVIGLLLTAIGTVIEAFVQPFISSTNPAFVQAMLDMVEGQPIGADLGPLPILWSVSSACFLVGTIAFGLANFRAGVLSRWASAVFGIGLFAMAPVVAAAGAPRLAALPIGLGLAWLGYSLLTRRQRPAVEESGALPVLETGDSAA